MGARTIEHLLAQEAYNLMSPKTILTDTTTEVALKPAESPRLDSFIVAVQKRV